MRKKFTCLATLNLVKSKFGIHGKKNKQRSCYSKGPRNPSAASCDNIVLHRFQFFNGLEDHCKIESDVNYKRYLSEINVSWKSLSNNNFTQTKGPEQIYLVFQSIENVGVERY